MYRRNFLLYTLLFAAGCGAANITSSSDPVLPETLTFTVTDAEGLEELEADYGTFRAALAEALNTNVEFFPVSGHLAAAPAMLAGKVDLVWAGPSEYLVLAARAEAVPVVTLKRPDFRSVVIVRADSGIQSLSDLKGKTIDLRKVGSTTSHLGGAQILLAAGLKPDVDVKTVMSGKRTLQGVKNGEVDAVVMATHRYQTILEEENLAAEDYPILQTGELLPGDIFVASNQLDAAIVETIQSRMLNHQEQLVQGIVAAPSLAKKFKGASLVTVNTEAYDIFRGIYEAIGQEELIQ
ncbi:MAG: PhnD/SsuA/transferrin family substrate-binding protein [Spirulina sp. SIO3F2]|nr:PhnD/SsuA/transferrin family substrate-binding protein [Spirulina sp. SIO3F2]